ncbi:MAG: hypothetical protein ACJAYU_000340 [Bradymonadia bacterium]
MKAAPVDAGRREVGFRIDVGLDIWDDIGRGVWVLAEIGF